ncbi:MAG: phosphomannomutase/phosphoglucomutase [Fastidiosipila sp.]|nr:phosphomannomutase/phosphoglucomutase [Fastidiosipila sp.]
MQSKEIDWTSLQNGSDIRGVALNGIENEKVNLSSPVARAIGVGFAEWLSEHSGKLPCNLKIALGHDSRISAPELSQAFLEGVAAAGADTYYLGLASTPALFMSCITQGFEYDGSVMVTASHLPWNRNGFKFFTADGGLDKEDITYILDRAAAAYLIEAPNDWTMPDQIDFMREYSSQLVRNIRQGVQHPIHPDTPLKGLHIVVDAGNGAGGFFVDRILVALGAETNGSQFLEPDGYFPNHAPNPEDSTAIASLRTAVLRENADLGIIFDTDVDRAGVVDHTGLQINRNRLIALMAAMILEEHPGTTIVTDSVTSDELSDFIRELGGIHHRYRRGYRNVINEAIRLNEAGKDTQLAMETSGHGAFKENYFLDDGAYTVTRILIKLAQLRQEGGELNDLLASLTEPLEAEEYRFRLTTDEFESLGQEIIAELKYFAKTSEEWSLVPDNYEGVRVAVAPGHGDGWFLLRLSLHDPVLPLNIEAREPGGVKRIAAQLNSFLSRWPEIDLSDFEK